MVSIRNKKAVPIAIKAEIFAVNPVSRTSVTKRQEARNEAVNFRFKFLRFHYPMVRAHVLAIVTQFMAGRV
jgi:hypothetical protein